MNRITRVIIADDSPHARKGLCAILAAQPDLDIVGEASQGEEALALVEAARPQVALLDVCMPGLNGIQTARAIKNRWPEVRVILISLYADYQKEALEAGADAFLVKGCPPEELINALTGASSNRISSDMENSPVQAHENLPVYILALSDPSAALENAGGKGMSLAKMAQAGMPIPDGFHITTQAYRVFVEVNGLQPKILSALQQADPERPDTLEAVSGSIRNCFTESNIPSDLAQSISHAYDTLAHLQPSIENRLAVAVRSSATAEDLPEASFAGQQETYLNMRSLDALLEAVKKCWASLWTARAIAYRIKKNMDHSEVALAVVVQELVHAEAAGVLFSANPMSGRRDEMVINAAWGLGEAIVAGKVSPDTIIADHATGKIKKMDVTDKTVITVETKTGTEEKPLTDGRRSSAVLDKVQVAELVGIARRIESLYGKPQDIEWCRSGGNFYIVQARPITALPEPPLEWPVPKPGAVMARGSFAEFVPEPVSPLFATLAVPLASTASTQLMNQMGVKEKDSYLFAVINGYLYVGFVITARFAWQMINSSVRMLDSVIKTSRQRGLDARQRFMETVEKWQRRDPARLRPSEIVAGVREIFAATAEFYTVGQSSAIPTSLTSEMVLAKYYDLLVKRKGDPEAAVFVFGSENLAMRADKALYDLAAWVKEHPQLEDYLTHTPTGDICSAIQNDPTPNPLLKEFSLQFQHYLAEFGHAIYDLDFSKPVPADDPAPLLETLKVYLSGRNNPHERQRVALERSSQAVESIVKRLDPLRRKWFLSLLHWAQDTAPLREDCIGDMGLGHPLMRRMLRELGRRLAAESVIPNAEDIYWLEASEVDALAGQLEAGGRLTCHFIDIEKRKSHWLAMKRIIPPNTLPVKTWLSRFYANNNQGGNTIKGFAANPGRVTAPACVMLGPEDFGKMHNGDVIVSCITTPAWTPLFIRAAAIVTDIGGPLSHSSIVAREYGIPAVLATGVATRRIREDQLITVDGNTGTVELK